MINYEFHGNNIISFRIPVSEFFGFKFSSGFNPLIKEREVEEYARKFFNFNVKVTSLEKISSFFQKYKFPLSDLFLSKKNKINRLVYLVFRDSNSFFESFKNSFNLEALNIGGFYDYSKSIILIVSPLRDVTINKYNFTERLTPNGLSNIYKVTIHELTHYTYSKSEGFRKESKAYVDGFYSDFFKLIFGNDRIYKDLLKPHIEKLIECESRRISCDDERIVNNIVNILKEYKSAAKDKILYEETIRVYKVMLDPKGMSLFSNIFFQKAMKKVYEVRGIVDYPGGGNTIHGQELIYPSEILCVTADKLLISSTAKKYATMMLRHL